LIEIEVKLQLGGCGEIDRVERLLVEVQGAVKEEDVVEEDIYLQHPCRDFALTDEALRVRSVNGRMELTYKGPKKLVGGVKSRTEITIVFEPGRAQQLLKLLNTLGFKRVLTVKKQRTYYRLRDAIVALDRVEDLGCFIEIEYRGEGGVEEARRRLEEIVEALGLSGKPRITKSYLELLLSKKTKKT